MKNISYATPLQHCCYCGEVMDAASCITSEGARPHTGDVTVCSSCAGVHVFGPLLEIRKPSLEELISIKSSPDYVILERVRSVILNTS